jgi:hypothetical protein
VRACRPRPRSAPSAANPEGDHGASSRQLLRSQTRPFFTILIGRQQRQQVILLRSERVPCEFQRRH